MFSTVFAIISIVLIVGIIVVIISTIFFSKDNVVNENNVLNDNEEGSHLSDDDSVGKEAINLVKTKKMLLSSDYLQAMQLFRKGNYEQIDEALQKLSDLGVLTQSLYWRAINRFIDIKNYSAAEKIIASFAEKFILTSDDYLNFGWVKYCLGNNEDALINYEKALELNPSNTYALNNRGYSYNLMGNYEQAIVDFDKAIELNPKFAYAYNNRSFAKIKLGLLEEGLSDNTKSIELDAKNAYAYRNLGIYQLEKNQLNEALQLFLKSKEMDKNIPLVDGLIAETIKKIEDNKLLGD